MSSYHLDFLNDELESEISLAQQLLASRMEKQFCEKMFNILKRVQEIKSFIDKNLQKPYGIQVRMALSRVSDTMSSIEFLFQLPDVKNVCDRLINRKRLRDQTNDESQEFRFTRPRF